MGLIAHIKQGDICYPLANLTLRYLKKLKITMILSSIEECGLVVLSLEQYFIKSVNIFIYIFLFYHIYFSNKIKLEHLAISTGVESVLAEKGDFVTSVESDETIIAKSKLNCIRIVFNIIINLIS